MRKFLVSYFIDNSIAVNYKEVTVFDEEILDLNLIEKKVEEYYCPYRFTGYISVIAWSLMD